MRRPIIAVVFSLFTAAATAQCVVHESAAMTVAATPALPATHAAPAAPRGGELISTASAQDIQVAMQTAAPRAKPAPARATLQNDKEDRRTGWTMLFAAVALMYAIALKRYSAPSQ